MAEWRDRGYVPDSDDEDNSFNCPPPRGALPYASTQHHPLVHSQSKDLGQLSQNQASQLNPSQPGQASQPPSRTQPVSNIETTASPTAHKLQAELHRALQACKDALTITPRQLEAFLEEDDSSLSSLSTLSSPVSNQSFKAFSPRPPSSPQQTNDQALLQALRSSPPGLPSPLNIAAEADYLPTIGLRRSLRPRTLLQLNPYSLEYARYQELCNRRGIVPVRLANFAAARAKANTNDTQLSELSDSFQEIDAAVSPIRSQSSNAVIPDGGTDEPLLPANSPPDRWNTLEDDDDELPDLADILSRPLNSINRRHAKTHLLRKKASKVVEKTNDTPVFKRYRLPWEKTKKAQDDLPARQHSAFDHPLSLSPPASTPSDQPMIHGGDELQTVQITPASLPTPAALPTPAVSSGHRITKRKVVELASSSPEEDEPGLALADRESQPSESENEDSQGLFQIRRKIKGVLPASWLKLDAKQQNVKTTVQSRVSHENASQPTKGVAKHISPIASRILPHSSAPRPIIFSSDVEESSTSEDEPPAPSIQHAPQTDLDLGIWESDGEMYDVQVEDQVDRMLPSVSQPRQQRKSQTTQRRIEDAWSTSRLPKPSRKQGMPVKSRSTTRRTAIRPVSKRSKTSHRSRQITVLDAPGFSLNRTQSPPRYLRIAARKRPSRQTAMSQNVSRKYIQLPDLGEHINLNQDLEEGGSERPFQARLTVQSAQTSDEMDDILQDGPYQQSNQERESTDSLLNLKQSTTAIVTRLRAGALRRLHPRQAVTSTRPHEDIRHLSFSRAANLNRPYRFQSAVPQWLERVRLSQQPSLPNAERVISVQPRPPPSHTIMEATTDPQPRQPRPHHERKRSRKRKSRPQKSSAKNLSTAIDFPTIPPPYLPNLTHAGAPQINSEPDEALVVWVLDHLSIDDAISALPKVPSVYDNSLISQFDLDSMLLNLFSRSRLPDIFLGFQSAPEICDSPDRSSRPADELQTFANWVSHVAQCPEQKGCMEEKVAAFVASTFTGSLSQLAATLLILSILCPLSLAITESLQSANDLSRKDLFDGWQVLQPILSRFLNLYTASASQSQSLGRRLGFLTMHFCYLAVRRWQWSSSEAIIKFWFKQYAQNDMIELFVVPDLRRVTQRSERPALSLSTDCNDTDYDIFLKLVAALLETRVQTISLCGDDVGRAVSRIQSLIFSISPNNSRKLSDDQSLHLEDLVSMANIYALYEYLNEFAPPGCQPRFALVEKLIDFPNCHWRVSQFALRTWSRFANNAINRADITMLSTLGVWIKKTTEQMALKLPRPCSDHSEPQSSSTEYALQTNASQTRQQIAELLLAWKAALVRCASDNECNALLNGGRIESIIAFCVDKRLNSDVEVVTKVCELVEKYLDRADSSPGNMVRNALQKQFRSIMITTLSSEDQLLPTACLEVMTSLWYHFARVTVRSKQKTWDEYLLSPSSWSFGVLATSELSRRCKVLFLSRIIEDDTMHFEIDRETFYSAWIEGLVQPPCNLCFEHELTKSIILNETDEMPFQDLCNILRGTNGTLQLDLSDFKQSQFEIVKHVIRSLFLLQFEDEDSQDFLGKPLNLHQGRKLLQLMTNTIKACWRALPISDRASYTDFAQSVVTQLRIYKYKDFDIDPWFTDPQQPEFPKEVLFASQFLLPVSNNHIGPGPIKLDERLIRIFMAGNLQAAGTQKEPVWSSNIVRALSATANTAVSAVDIEGRLAINADLQFTFIREVMTVLISNIFQSPRHALFTRPILTALLEIVRGWHFRLDINSDPVLDQMLFTAVDLLASIVDAVTLTSFSQLLGGFIVADQGEVGPVGSLIEILVDLGSACLRRVTMLEGMVEANEQNIEAVEMGYDCANALYDHLLVVSLPMFPRHCGQLQPDPTSPTRWTRTRTRTTLMSSKTQAILDQSLHGRTAGQHFQQQGQRQRQQSWRMEHPLANSWDTWFSTVGDNTTTTGGNSSVALQSSHFAVDAFETSLQKLKDALIEADIDIFNAFSGEEETDADADADAEWWWHANQEVYTDTALL